MDMPNALPAGQYAIYALIDPADQLVYYVGQTRNPAKRLAEHLRTHTSESAKAAWLRNLRERGQQPIMQILETVTGLETALKQEQKWILAFGEKGMPLVNIETQREALQRRRSTQVITAIGQETFLFCGYPVIKALLPGGQRAIVLKHLVQPLQLSRPGQLQRLQRDPLLRKSLVYVLVKTKRGSHVVLALMEEAIFSWITTIQSGTFSPEKRQLLLDFQREAAKLTQPSPTMATPEKASRLLRLNHRKRMADSKRKWQAMKAELASLKARLVSLEAHIEKTSQADDSAPLRARVLSMDHLIQLTVLAEALRSRTGEPIKAIYADLSRAFGVEEINDIPDASWQAVLSWLWQRGQQ